MLVNAFLAEGELPEGDAPTVGADFKVRMLKHAGKDWEESELYDSLVHVYGTCWEISRGIRVPHSG